MSRQTRRKQQIVVGFDPGYARMGYAVLARRGSSVDVRTFGCIETPKSLPYNERLVQLEHEIQKICTKYHPTICAIERLFFQKNVKTAIAVGQARGVLLLTLTKNGIPPIECSPQQVKLAATGYGNASKQQVQHMIQRLLRLPRPPKPDDAADALAVALAATTYQHDA